MGENAFIAFTVCKVLGMHWQTALGAVLIAGVAFILMTVLHLRKWIVDGVPTSLRYSFAVGMGLFLTFIGLNETGLVRLGVPGAPVQAGNLTSAPVLVAMFGVVVLAILIIRKVPGAILLGIVLTSLVAFVTQVAATPHKLISMPPSLASHLLASGPPRRFNMEGVPGGADHLCYGICRHDGDIDRAVGESGLPRCRRPIAEIEKPMLVDAITTTLAPALGTSTSGAYVESATGIEAGGRTGLTALVTGTCFLLALFFAPFVATIPPQAFGPALIIVGLFMLAPITKIDFRITRNRFRRLRLFP